MKHSLADVWSLANTTIAEIEQWLQMEGKSVKLKFPEKSQAMLLRLQVWSFRYSLSVGEILDLVMPILLGQVRFKKPSHGLGVTISLLTSNRVEEILQVEIRKHYPENEHVSVAKGREQEKQLYVEQLEANDGMPIKSSIPEIMPNMDGSVDQECLDNFVLSYKTQMKAARQDYKNRAHANWRIRKPYRGSPWR